MKQILLVLLFGAFALIPTVKSQQSHQASNRSKPKATPCPGVFEITDCPDEGCGNGADPELNKRKNIRAADGPATPQSFRWFHDFAKPPRSDCGTAGFSRDNVTEFEGQKVTVVAWALAARAEGQETCNCKLYTSQDTDVHIVLADPQLKDPILANDEIDSQTVEFTPRVRLDHPNFTQEKLEPLIDPEWRPGETPKKGKLLVRVTGLLMFDSEHFCHMHLKRNSDWEIHPIFKMEYCPEGQQCTAESDENWKDLESD
jgi:hypothetical protein